MAALSRDAGIPYRTLQNYLSGTNAMPAEVLGQLCRSLGISADWVLSTEADLRWLLLGGDPRRAPDKPLLCEHGTPLAHPSRCVECRIKWQLENIELSEMVLGCQRQLLVDLEVEKRMAAEAER